MRRYLLVVPEFPPEELGGGGVVYKELALRYADLGELLVITGGWSGRFRTPSLEMISERCLLLRLPVIANRWDIPAMRSTLPPTPSGRRLLNLIIRAWNPGVAHLHGIGYLLVDGSARLLTALGIPYILTNHGMPISYRWGKQRMLKQFAYNIYTELFARKTIEGASRITAVSDVEASKLDYARVIPNGIAIVPDFEIKPPTYSGFEFVDNEDETPMVLSCGRLVPNKGFHVLLDALQQIRLPLRCVIAGADGGELARLKDMAIRLEPAIKIIFSGSLLRGELAWLMRKASLVVIPSISEPFGLVAFEALGMGTRIVATDTGGMGEWLQDPTLPVSRAVPGNTTSLADCIRSALELGPPTPQELHAVRDLLEVLSWEKIATQYLDLLNGLYSERLEFQEPGWWSRLGIASYRNVRRATPIPPMRLNGLHAVSVIDRLVKSSFSEDQF